jgi:hypothetical protein
MPKLVLSQDKLLVRDGKLAVADDPCDCCGDPCGLTAISGGEGTTVNYYSMPSKAGVVTFRYDSYTVPDRYVVEGDGQIYIDTGEISGNGTLTFCKPEGVRKVKVTVTGPDGTLWGYDIGCPQEDCTPSRSGGPGSELTRILGNFWIRYTPGCKCEERASRMNQMGPAWCRENIELISKWLKEEAESRGLPYVDWLGHQVILQAIAAAEAKALLEGDSTPT